jgi:hypothetical protein
MKVKALIQVLLQCDDELELEFVHYPQANAMQRYNEIFSVTEVRNRYTSVPSTSGILQIELKYEFKGRG